MEIDMEKKFLELKSIVDKAGKFSFGLKTPYPGPVSPTSIITFGSNVIRINALVLAERVPQSQLPYKLAPDHFEAVVAYLTDTFNFQQYHAEVNELLGLSILVADPEYAYDGTVRGADEFFKNKGWSLKILYEAAPKNGDNNGDHLS